MDTYLLKRQSGEGRSSQFSEKNLHSSAGTWYRIYIVQHIHKQTGKTSKQ